MRTKLAGLPWCGQPAVSGQLEQLEGVAAHAWSFVLGGWWLHVTWTTDHSWNLLEQLEGSLFL